MARLWREYKTPDGSKYYYNIESKQSTRERPSDFAEQELDGKKRKLQQTKVACSLDLANNSKLSICQDGSRRFKLGDSGTLQEEIGDEESLNILSQSDEQKLKRLVRSGKKKGEFDTQVHEEVLKHLETLTNPPEKAAEEKGQESDFPSSNSESSAEDHIVAGYSTSEEESDNEVQSLDEVHSESEAQTENELHKENFSSGSSSDLENKEIFTSMFPLYSLDPFSTWNMQSKKLQDDPRFYKVGKDSVREQYFEEWCTRQCNNSKSTDDYVNESELDSESEPDSDRLEPTKYHYLSHIVSKATIKPETLAKDIRAEQKTLFRQFKIKNSLDKKAQEAFISKILFYYKKLDHNQRVDVFEKLLDSKSRSIELGLRHTNKLKDMPLHGDLPEKPFAIETLLLELEDCIDIHGLNKSIQTEVQYYVLGIKPKTIAMKKCLQNYESKV
ncbi:LAME_0H19086g1_1 [Lachancea meyersii CBS 8951]|uniref:LAME_0H19086g1_1 n=1 Tax=Lachancea meyersii CBS 8951 TaxID=1266667 RepID=A0A1G4KJ52_9SACH|nr:LAME_0H19086g1_1 [Lachancea meyersii CBS 8951]